MKDDGGSAFPVVTNIGIYYAGMTLRDYFAAAALKGMCANPSFWKVKDEAVIVSPALLATNAYACADAMLKERAK